MPGRADIDPSAPVTPRHWRHPTHGGITSRHCPHRHGGRGPTIHDFGCTGESVDADRCLCLTRWQPLEKSKCLNTDLADQAHRLNERLTHRAKRPTNHSIGVADEDARLATLPPGKSDEPLGLCRNFETGGVWLVETPRFITTKPRYFGPKLSSAPPADRGFARFFLSRCLCGGKTAVPNTNYGLSRQIGIGPRSTSQPLSIVQPIGLYCHCFPFKSVHLIH
jgi:hypothetical protein